MKRHPGERHDLKCPEPGCGKPMKLRPSRFGLFYGCAGYPQCRGTHGAHPNGAPLGTPATRTTKDARIRAHHAFDRIWMVPAITKKEQKARRVRAYAWLAKQMGVKEIHIGRLNAGECDEVVKICNTIGWTETGGPVSVEDLLAGRNA